jgi:hypothetical protein
VFGEAWTLPRLLGVIVVFGLLYAIVTWVVVLDRAERRRFAGAARRRLPGASASYDAARGARR